MTKVFRLVYTDGSVSAWTTNKAELTNSFAYRTNYRVRIQESEMEWVEA